MVLIIRVEGALSRRIDTAKPLLESRSSLHTWTALSKYVHMDKSRDNDWQERGACIGEDPELFFPVGNTGPAVLQIAEAKAVCRTCPVMAECLRYALEYGEDHGVWGGHSEDERKAIKRRNSRKRRADLPDDWAINY